MSCLKRIDVRLRVSVLVFAVVAAGTSFSACSMPGSVLPVVKIGLVAPFEGPQRTQAYDVLAAVKAAVQNHNDANRRTGPLVELIALNDNGLVEEARRGALQMVVDPAILGVIGPWSAEGAAAGNDVYMGAGLAVVYPVVTATSPASPRVSAQEPAIPSAYPARDAANVLLEAIREVSANSDLTRENVLKQIQTQDHWARFTSPMASE